jgi:hypothetical protein
MQNFFNAIGEFFGQIIARIIAKKVCDDPLIKREMENVKKSAKIVANNADKWKAIDNDSTWDEPEQTIKKKTHVASGAQPKSKEKENNSKLATDISQIKESSKPKKIRDKPHVFTPPSDKTKVLKFNSDDLNKSESDKPKKYMPSDKRTERDISKPLVGKVFSTSLNQSADKESKPKKYIPKT